VALILEIRRFRQTSDLYNKISEKEWKRNLGITDHLSESVSPILSPGSVLDKSTDKKNSLPKNSVIDIEWEYPTVGFYTPLPDISGEEHDQYTVIVGIPKKNFQSEVEIRGVM
jgi:hypothetical protein